MFGSLSTPRGSWRGSSSRPRFAISGNPQGFFSSPFDLLFENPLSSNLLDRGAEAISSRPGGSEQLRRPERKGLLSIFLPKSSPGADHRGDWGTRLRLAHCHPSQADGALLRSEETRVSPLADFPSPTSSSDSKFHGSI